MSEQVKMLRNAVKQILTRDNWELVEGRWSEDPEMYEVIISKYHKLGEDKEATNRYVKDMVRAYDTVIEMIDKQIELHEKAIEGLKELRKSLLMGV